MLVPSAISCKFGMLKPSFLKRWLVFLFVLIAAMPIRLWFSLGPFKTCTIFDIAIVFIATGLFLFQRFRNIKVGHQVLFIALCTPIAVAILSLIWSECPLSTVRLVIYYAIAILGYLVALNIFYRCSSSFIAGCMASFVITTLLFATLYWFRVPFALSLAEISIGKLEGMDQYAYSVAFVRLNHPYLGLSNDVATTLSLYVIFFMGLTRVTSRLRYASITALAALGVLLTLSRGVVTIMVGVAVVALMLRPSFRSIIATALVAGLLIAPVYWFTEHAKNSGIDILGNRIANFWEIGDRLDLFSFGLYLIEQSPLLGYGGGRYMAEEYYGKNIVFHNTYLEQLASYGIFFGTLTILALLSLPIYFFRWTSKYEKLNSIARFIGFSVVLYLFVCCVETSNEAAIPRLMFYFFLGSAIAYLRAIEWEGVQR